MVGRGRRSAGCLVFLIVLFCQSAPLLSSRLVLTCSYQPPSDDRGRRSATVAGLPWAWSAVGTGQPSAALSRECRSAVAVVGWRTWAQFAVRRGRGSVMGAVSRGPGRPWARRAAGQDVLRPAGRSASVRGGGPASKRGGTTGGAGRPAEGAGRDGGGPASKRGGTTGGAGRPAEGAGRDGRRRELGGTAGRDGGAWRQGGAGRPAKGAG